MSTANKVISFEKKHSEDIYDSYETSVKTQNGIKSFEINIMRVPPGLSPFMARDLCMVYTAAYYKREGKVMKPMLFGASAFSLRLKGKSADEAAKEIAEDFARPTLMDGLLKR
jgi:hypothetical protein